MKLRERSRKEIQFQSKINKLLKQVDRLDSNAVKKTAQLIIETQKRVNSRLADEILEGYDGWDLTHLPRLKNAINQVIVDFSRRYNVLLQPTLAEAFEIGIGLVDEPIKAQIPILALPEMSRTTLEIWQGYSADLVKSVSDDTIKWINTELTLGITGEKSPFQVMQVLGKKVKGNIWPYKYMKGTPFHKAMIRAEYITRTEISRVLNLSTHKRQKQLAETHPEIKKYWLQSPSKYPRDTHRAVAQATDPALGGTPIGIDEFFNVAGYQVAGPHDAALPAKEVINCGCRSVIWMEDFQ